MEELPASQLRLLEDLLQYLSQIRQAEPMKMRVNLSQWFENLFGAGWQSLEALGCDFKLSDASVKGAKLIDLGVQPESQALVLLVAITKEAEPHVGIRVQLHPEVGENYLPPNLRLVMLSESGATLQSVESRSIDNYIQLHRFWGQPGESFGIHVALEEASVTETFVI